jgi:hypothetical protein
LTSENNIHAIPNQERDDILAAMAVVERLMPQQAKVAKTMMDEFVKAGFTDDQALQLVAYSIFR